MGSNAIVVHARAAASRDREQTLGITPDCIVCQESSDDVSLVALTLLRSGIIHNATFLRPPSTSACLISPGPRQNRNGFPTVQLFPKTDGLLEHSLRTFSRLPETTIRVLAHLPAFVITVSPDDLTIRHFHCPGLRVLATSP
jgi:hypothetical protein